MENKTGIMGSGRPEYQGRLNVSFCLCVGLFVFLWRKRLTSVDPDISKTKEEKNVHLIICFTDCLCVCDCWFKNKVKKTE